LLLHWACPELPIPVSHLLSPDPAPSSFGRFELQQCRSRSGFFLGGWANDGGEATKTRRYGRPLGRAIDDGYRRFGSQLTSPRAYLVPEPNQDRGGLRPEVVFWGGFRDFVDEKPPPVRAARQVGRPLQLAKPFWGVLRLWGFVMRSMASESKLSYDKVVKMFAAPVDSIEHFGRPDFPIQFVYLGMGILFRKVTVSNPSNSHRRQSLPDRLQCVIQQWSIVAARGTFLNGSRNGFLLAKLKHRRSKAAKVKTEGELLRLCSGGEEKRRQLCTKKVGKRRVDELFREMFGHRSSAKPAGR